MNHIRAYMSGSLVALLLVAGVGAAGANVALPDPALDDALSKGGQNTVVLAGGCFWGSRKYSSTSAASCR